MSLASLREKLNIQTAKPAATSTPTGTSSLSEKLNSLPQSTISQGTPDPVQEARQRASSIPIVGKFLTGTGPQGPSTSLYPQGSIRQSIVEKGLVGFLLEGFNKKVNPTRAEVGEQIMERYDAMQNLPGGEDRKLSAAIQDVIEQSPGLATNIQELRDPGVELTAREKDALFWVNTFEDAFAILDAPIFLGTTKIPKEALLTRLKGLTKVADVKTTLKLAGFSDKKVTNKLAESIAKSTNEIEISKLINRLSDKTPVSEAASTLTSRLRGGRGAETTRRLDLPEPRKIEPRTTLDDAAKVREVRRARKTDSGDGPYFRRENNQFKLIPEEQVTPAFIDDALDTFMMKEGDRFMVIEGRTGSIVGSGDSMPKALKAAKDVVAREGESLIREIDEAPLSPRYEQVGEAVAEAPAQPKKRLKQEDIPEGVTTADKLKSTDKQAARRLRKLEVMAETSGDVDEFVSETGITRAALDKTVQKQGYDDTADFFNKNRPREVDPDEARSFTQPAREEPPAPAKIDEEQSFELLAEQQAGSDFMRLASVKEEEQITMNLREIFAEMNEVKLDDPKLKFSDEDLFQIQQNYEFISEALVDDPARGLTKYLSRSTGRLPEVTGTEFITSPKGTGKIKNSTFGRKGDDIVTELGFEDADAAQEAVEKYLKRRDEAREIFENFREIRDGIKLQKAMNTFVDKNVKLMAREVAKNKKGLQNLVEAARKAGFQKGKKVGSKKYAILIDRIKDRRQRINGLKWAYNLTDGEVKKVLGDADPRFMEKAEFEEFMRDVDVKAQDFEKRRVERGIVRAIIEQKELKNTENLREAMKLPPLTQMNLDELGRYEKMLTKLEDGDELLSKRTLEVIDRTVLKGAKTVRQVRNYLKQDIKKTLGRDVKPGELEDLISSDFDFYKWDSVLAEGQPFVAFLVNRTHKHMLAGESNFLRIQDRIQTLAKAANKSRKRTLKQKVKQQLIPTQENIVKYLEARGEERDFFAKGLTKEELEYAEFMRRYYNSAYNYLSYIEELKGSRYIDAYFTHVRKGFLEKWSDDGFISAMKNVWDEAKEDMVIANIIDKDTGKILPKSKFFQFTLRRTGEGEVSQNVTRVFLKYARLFERKKMLDKMIPELDVYTRTLTPKDLTPRGLEMNRQMREFVNEYLNTKRGRRNKYMFVAQNGIADMMIRTGNTLISIMDLGFNFMAGTAAIVGENVANYVALGKTGVFRGYKRRIWDTGIKRMANPNAAKILDDAEAFIGRNIWTELAEVNKPVFEKGLQTLFSMFSQSTVEANKIFLLANLTEAELKAGKISADRMAQLRLDAGRWRDMGSDVKSIVGATSPGQAFTKYKGWALPIFTSTAKNLTKTADRLAKGKFKETLSARETKELMREIEITTVALYIGSMITAHDEDDGFVSKLKARIQMEALTILGGVDPDVLMASPRLVVWLRDLADNLKKIVKLEEYKTDSKYGDKGDLKGIGGIKQQFTPGFVRQFIPDNRGGSSGGSTVPSGPSSQLDALKNLRNVGNLQNVGGPSNLDALQNLQNLGNVGRPNL